VQQALGQRVWEQQAAAVLRLALRLAQAQAREQGK
jgi:hypothetical protein